jgi:uncharacterized protein YdeI (BOF family)
MKSLNLFRLLTMVVLVLGLASIPLCAQQQPGAQDPTSQAPSAQTQPQSAQQAQTFTGKIVQAKDGLAFRDDATSSTYKVDNEDQLKQFVGKKVKVTGTLDPATNMIHVANVEVSPS